MRRIEGVLVIVALTSAISACGIASADAPGDQPAGAATGAVTAAPAATPGPAPAPGKQCTTVSRGATVALRCVVANHGAKRLDRRASDPTRLRHLATSTPTAARTVTPRAVSVQCDQGVSNPDRFTSCSDDFWEITETETVDGVTTVIGELPVEIFASAQFGTDDILNWTLSAEIITGPGEGTLSAGLAGSAGTKCGQRPDVCETDSAPGDSEPIALEPETSVLREWDQSDNGNVITTANSVDDLTGFIGVILELEAPSNPVTIDDASIDTLWGRCDNVVGEADCVDPFGPIAVAFDATTNPVIGPVADHVFQAEASLPSHWGNPNFGDSAGLTRDMSQADQDANRAVACPSGQTPPGQSCDEYPMASTHQGAAFSPPGDWSTAFVTPASNDSQGGVLANFYKFFHVLDGDEFFVLAVRADGSSSW
jgi:hypothetical protein